MNLKNLLKNPHIGGSSIHRSDAVRMYSLLSSYKARFLLVKKARKKQLKIYHYDNNKIRIST